MLEFPQREVERYALTAVHGPRIHNYGAASFERQPALIVYIHIGADSPVSLGRGRFAIGEYWLQYMSAIPHRSAGWIYSGSQCYSYIVRDDDRECTELQRKTFREACIALAPPAPTMASLEPELQREDERLTEGARVDYVNALSTAERSAEYAAEWARVLTEGGAA